MKNRTANTTGGDMCCRTTSLPPHRIKDTMTDQTIELTIPSHPRFLQLVRGVMKKVAGILAIPRDQTDYLILAVDEASSNIIRHSYREDPDHRIDFSITLGEGLLDISITDYGAACNPARFPQRDPAEIKPGGLGLYIIDQVMDHVDYTCGENGRNTIRMTKHITRDTRPAS